MRKNLTPNDEFYFDPYGDEDDIFDQPTVFLEEESVVDEAGITSVENKIYDILNISALAKAYSHETPGMSFMYAQALGKALRKPEVRNQFRQFVTELFSQTEETMLAHRHNPDFDLDEEDACEDCKVSYPLNRLTCANTLYTLDECDCDGCEGYCSDCFEEE
jgi:hypothetical protein